MIHPETQVPIEEHVYNLWRIGNKRPDYMYQYGFQATNIHYTLTKISMKCGLKEFKPKGKESGNIGAETVTQERRIMAHEDRGYFRKSEARVTCTAHDPKIKMRRINKRLWKGDQNKTTGENRTKGRLYCIYPF